MTSLSAEPASDAVLQLAAYDHEAVYGLLRDWTPRRMAGELAAGRFGAQLSAAEAAELDGHLTAWAQRALAELSLRDALLVDERRGRRVFALLCVELTAARVLVPAELAAALPATAACLGELPPSLALNPELVALAARVGSERLALVAQHAHDDYPFPEDLATLAPPLPREPETRAAFVQPVGWRRRVAALLAGAGVALLAGPMLGGQIPDHPARLPLALLTLALLVGIRAGWRGFAGSLCIWLVANLPGFRHGTQLSALWPALPLLAIGLLLLSLDRNVRSMWGWLRKRIAH